MTDGTGDDRADLGKIDRSFFESYVYPHLGADREDVALGPAHGVDFGVASVGGRAVVTATDPLSILPGLGYDRAARFALSFVLADVAVSGVAPTHLSISFSLPPEMDDEAFATCWRAIDAECRDLGVSVLTGHTARYSGVSFPWVGAATAFGIGDHDQVIRPDGARPGDRLLLTKGPAVETAGLFATLFGERLDLDPSALAAARARLEDTGVVREALTAAAAGPVTALHDATECGLAGALVEFAGSAGVRLDVDREAVPVLPGVEATCEALGIEPWHASSSGTLVIAVEPAGVAAVLEALEAEGVPAAAVGRVREGEGVFVDGERIEHPRVDPSWAAFAAYAGHEE